LFRIGGSDAQPASIIDTAATTAHFIQRELLRDRPETSLILNGLPS
jgi:hypothetical protein